MLNIIKIIFSFYLLAAGLVQVLANESFRESLIDWKRLNPEQWLDLQSWKKDLLLKEADKNWRKKLRDTLKVNQVGIVVQCLNDCRSFTGPSSAQASYGSKLWEGSQYVTGEDSAAWVMLSDGALLRLSAKTSVTFYEVNWSADRVFHFLRLNYGHVYIESRQEAQASIEDWSLSKLDTDLGMYPLLEVDANRESYLSKNSLHKRFLGVKEQVDFLKELTSEEKYNETFVSEWFVFTANANLKAKNFVGHLFYQEDNGLAIYHENSFEKSARVELRKDLVNILKPERGVWFFVDAQGVSAVQKDLVGGDYARYFVKRIQTIRLARELLLRKNFNQTERPWIESDLNKRQEFLHKWTQNNEETQLKRLDFKNTLLEFDHTYYDEVVKRNVVALKSIPFYNQQILGMTSRDYYLWILKHAQPFLPSYLGQPLTSSKRDP